MERISFFFFFREGRRKGGKEEGREEGKKVRREGGRVRGREEREGRNSSNKRDIADLDLEVYKLISFFFFFFFF